MKNLKTAGRVVTVIAAAAILLAALYIMLHRIGLADELDFGAGAYYYTDIDNIEAFGADGAYKAKLPKWVHIVLFLGWGWLMYRLWVWIDSRK